MNAFEHLLTIALGIAIFYFAEEIVEYIRYLPIVRSARDSQNPIAIKIIGMLIALYGTGLLVFTILPRA